MLKNLYKKTTAMWIGVVFILILGPILSLKAPVSLYPKATKPQIHMGISHQGMSSKQFQELYGQKVEQALANHNDIDNVKSYYSRTDAKYEIEFSWGISDEEANSEVQKIQANFNGQFPKNWGSFWIWNQSVQSQRATFILSSETQPESQWGKYFREKYIPAFRNIKGVESAYVSRYDEQRINIELQPEKLAAFSLTPKQVENLLKSYEYDFNFGDWMLPQGSTLVLLKNQTYSLEEIKKLSIKIKNNVTISLDMIANIKTEIQLPNEVSRHAGQDVSFLAITIKSSADLASVSAEVKKLLLKITVDDMTYLKFNDFLYPTDTIHEAILDVVFAVILGIISAMIIVLVFLRKLTTTFVIAMSIPLSLLGGIIILTSMGIGINLISVGAMALVSGMVVDGSIVVLENIFSHLDEKDQNHHLSILDLIVFATKEVRSSLIASLLTTIIVFLPIPFTSPITNAILGDLAIVMIIVLLFSVLVTLFVIPTMIYSFVKIGWIKWQANPNSNSKESLLSKLYSKTLQTLMSKKIYTYVMILSVIVLFAGGVSLATKLHKEIIGKPNSKIAIINLNFTDPTMDQEKAVKLLDDLETRLIPFFNSDIVDTWVQNTNRWNGTSGSFLVLLRNRNDYDMFKKNIEDNFPSTEEFQVRLFNWNPSSLSIPNPSHAVISVSGNSQSERIELLDKIQTLLNSQDFVSGIDVNPNPKKKNILELVAPHYQWDLLAASSGGRINKRYLSDYLEFAFDKKLVRNLSFNEEDIEMYIKYQDGTMKDLDDLNNLPIVVEDKVVPLKSLVSINQKREQSNIYKLNGQEVYQLDLWKKSTFNDMTELELQNKITEILTKDSSINKDHWQFLPADVEVKENISSLLNALGISFLLIFFILVIQFSKLSQVFTIMSAIPLGMIGVSGSLYLFDSTLSVNSMLGMILLSGTAVNNSILITDFFNIYRKDHPNLSSKDIATMAAKQRLRPILITTFTTIIGMLPIAMAFGSGGKVLQPLGLAICGGLGISTLLVLYVVPMLLALDRERKFETPVQ